MNMIYRLILLCLWLGLVSSFAEDLIFHIPTPNRALFDGTEEGNKAFFAPTTSGIWQSGRYGCTRTAGWQFHEGIDILWTQRDRKGEPSDPVFATADGVILLYQRQAWLIELWTLLDHRPPNRRHRTL